MYICRLSIQNQKQIKKSYFDQTHNKLFSAHQVNNKVALYLKHVKIVPNRSDDVFVFINDVFMLYFFLCA